MGKTDGLETLLAAASVSVSYRKREQDPSGTSPGSDFTPERKTQLLEFVRSINDRSRSIGEVLLELYDTPAATPLFSIKAAKLASHTGLDTWVWSWLQVIDFERVANNDGETVIESLIEQIPVEVDLSPKQDQLSLLRLEDLKNADTLRARGGLAVKALMNQTRRALKDGDDDLRKSTLDDVRTKIDETSSNQRENFLTCIKGALDGGSQYYEAMLRSEERFKINGIERPYFSEIANFIDVIQES